jgi:hypothetical protein
MVFLFLSVIGFGVLLSIGIASVTFGQQFLNYKSDTIGVQIDYPDNWVYSDSFDSVYFIPSNESKLDKGVSEQEVLLLVTHDASVNYKNIPLESYLQYIKREFENRSRFIYSSPQPDKTDVGGLPAYSMEFVNMNGMHG